MLISSRLRNELKSSVAMGNKKLTR